MAWLCDTAIKPKPAGGDNYYYPDGVVVPVTPPHHGDIIHHPSFSLLSLRDILSYNIHCLPTWFAPVDVMTSVRWETAGGLNHL